MIEVSIAIHPGLPERIELTGTGGTAVVEMGEVSLCEFKNEKDELGPYGAMVRPRRRAELATEARPGRRASGADRGLPAGDCR